MESLFHLTNQIKKRVTNATIHTERITQSIPAKAFWGELVPQDPNDEPASVLLERIKMERAVGEKGTEEKTNGTRKEEEGGGGKRGRKRKQEVPIDG